MDTKFIIAMFRNLVYKVGNLKVDKTDIVQDFSGGTTKVSSAEVAKVLNERLTEKTSYGVLSGLFVSAQDTPDMTVKIVSGGIYMMNGDRFSPTSVEALEINVADASHPRYDILYVNSTGVITYLAGTAQVNPTAPTVPTGGQLLAEVFVPMAATAITNSEITDKRRMLSIIEDSSSTTYHTWSSEKLGTELNEKISKTDIAPTANRPSNPYLGQQIFDTTIGRPIWCKTTDPIVWVDATGTSV